MGASVRASPAIMSRKGMAYHGVFRDRNIGYAG